MLSESNSSIKHGNESMVVAMKKKAVVMIEKAVAIKVAAGSGSKGSDRWWR